ncbi:hypothetical protein BVX98_06565 [bacterium F11]|nr:hypothetical protein BVX98_06565 [bacterium F11]
MICSKCQKNEATVHFTGVVNGKTTQLDVCGSCSEKLGISFQSIFNFPTVPSHFSELFNLLSNWPQSPFTPLNVNNCPKCRWTVNQIQKTGKLGCSECYTHFQQELSHILKTIQGTTTHRGKKISVMSKKEPTRKSKKGKGKNMKDALEKLHAQLDFLVDEERFEEAANIRDKIREFENKPKKKDG